MHRRDFLKGSLVAGLGAAALPGVTDIDHNAESAGAEGVGLRPDSAAPISPFDLRCESALTPLGIDTPRPRFSWKLKAADGARGQVQSAYRVRVASSSALLAAGMPDLWDSGIVESAGQLHVEYNGRALVSGERCFWSVQVSDADGQASAPSETHWFEMGLLSQSDWEGIWISDGKPLPQTDAAFYEDDPAPIFRRSFNVDKAIRSARLYATGLGYAEFRLNGETVSDHVLSPAWTSFENRVYYTTYDVTDRLIRGENVIGAMLGNGWYNPLPLRMWGRINLREHQPVGRPRLIAQLVIEYGDGTRSVIASDDSWRVAPGPLLRNSVYLGETYDARREHSGWDRPGFDDSDWETAARAGSVSDPETDKQAPGATPETPRRSLGPLRASPLPPIRITRYLSPVSVSEVKPGVFIFDMGQNFAGWVRLRVRGPRGATVRMRMGELLYADGTLNVMTAVAGQIKGLREDGAPRGGPGAPEFAWQENVYTIRGGSEEVYTPRFTFHGFRYVEVTGFPGTPTLDTIEGLRLNTDVEPAGSFSCSNERLNRIQEMVQWTLLSNLFSVQSDCPGREKFQYGGDIVASSEMAIFGHDMARFYANTVIDFGDAVRGDGWFTETAPYVGIAAESYEPEAGPIGWGLAHPLLVAQLYRYYGDQRIVEEQYEPARKWVDLLEAHSDGLIIDRCIGDHESLDPKPIALMATAQFFQAASLVAGFAGILDRRADARHYETLADRIKAAFVERFLESGAGRLGIATQAAQATGLHLGLVPESETERAVQRMVDAVLIDHDGHVATGIFGTKYLLNALTAADRTDVALQMVNTSTFPGWVYMLEHGATTIWETWAESDNTYSQNHPMFGSVSEWFYKGLAGVLPDENAVGFDSFRIEPHLPPGLEWVEATYESVRGRIKSGWHREDDRVVFELEIPVNAKARVLLPIGDHAILLEGDRPVDEVPTLRLLPTGADGTVGFELGSGRYSFTAIAR